MRRCRSGTPSCARRGSTWALRALLPVFLLILMSLPATAGAQTTVVPYGAPDYRYMVVAHGALPTFQDPAFDDSAFSIGAAPFGSGGECPLGPTFQTLWPIDTDVLVRRTINFPAGASAVSVGIAIDNDVDVYWNGTLVGQQTHEGCATQDSLVVPVPDALVQAGNNVLAVRGIDRGIMSLLDIRVSAVVKAPPCGGRPATIVGTSGDDFISGTAGDDVIDGLGGNDVIKGRQGDDCLIGGDGRDLLLGVGGADKHFGGVGDDRIRGGDGNDKLKGGEGDDGLKGGFGDDSMNGGAGDDLCDGGPDTDTATMCEVVLGVP